MIVDAALAAAARPAPVTRPVLRVREAVKSFGSVQALRGASLELRDRELLALLGPNGAGKTTLIRAITGRVLLERGAIEVLGRELPAAERRRLLGVVPQEIALYPLLTARENLEVFGRLHGVPSHDLRQRVDEALEWTGLADRSREPIRSFSGGMKRRLNIACGVLHRPGVVLLDEPTAGVDPQSRERIYEMLARLRQGGASLLLTTHHLEEAEQRCDRVAILDHGSLVAAGTVAELVERTVGGDRQVIITVERAPAPREAMPGGTAPRSDSHPRLGLPGFETDAAGRRLTARVRDIGAELPALLASVQRSGARVEDVEVQRHGLHEVFLHLTGKELRE